MKIILLTDVPKVGKKYDIKDISDGYALNHLIPRKLAIAATPKEVTRINMLKKQQAEDEKIQSDLLEKNLKAIGEAVVTITSKANDKGHLFASIHAEHIVKELKDQAHIDISSSYIKLSQPIKEIGEHVLDIRASDKTAKLKVIIKSL